MTNSSRIAGLTTDHGTVDHLIGRVIDCLLLADESRTLGDCRDLARSARRLLERRIDARRCPN